ncbi:MAG: sulfotransferase domain-containing protein [Dongiaceae bacterium]
MGKIVWIASYPKSGNTWLRAFLHNLLRNPKEAYDINKLTDFTLGDSQAHWYQRFDPRPATEYSKEDLARLRPRVHELFTRTSPDSVFVKTHQALVEWGGAPMITMECTAGAFYVVRNPLDVVISHSHHYGYSIDETIAIMAARGSQTRAAQTHVPELHGSWTENVASWTARPHPGLHVVRYEDMQDRPYATFKGVVDFLRLPAPRARIERAIRRSSFKVLQEQERRQGFREKSGSADLFFRAGTAGQWRRVLTAAQVEAVVAAHREQMARFGYWPLPH